MLAVGYISDGGVMLNIAILLAGLAAPAEGRHDATIHHSFEDVAKWVEVFDDPGRDAWQKPDEVLHVLGVSPGMTVADLGAGTGYFSVRLAKAVGDKGRVLAIDVEPKLVNYMKERAAKANLAQLVPVLTDADDPKLPTKGVDLVLIVDTWHHIDDRLHYLAKLAAGLKAGGRVAVVDFKKGDFPVGPPDAHKLTADAVTAEFLSAGWTLAKQWDELPYQYVLVFSPPGASGGASELRSTDPRATDVSGSAREAPYGLPGTSDPRSS
jgi:ubiquinone/menaquinone biosynthesis C-methylase UbiE